jgi:hypothetical protein
VWQSTDSFTSVNQPSRKAERFFLFQHVRSYVWHAGSGRTQALKKLRAELTADPFTFRNGYVEIPSRPVVPAMATAALYCQPHCNTSVCTSTAASEVLLCLDITIYSNAFANLSCSSAAF